MIKEYHFAELFYNEETKEIGCGACGKAVNERKPIYRVAGRWVCGKCRMGLSDGIPSESALCSTVKAAIER